MMKICYSQQLPDQSCHQKTFLLIQFQLYLNLPDNYIGDIFLYQSLAVPCEPHANKVTTAKDLNMLLTGTVIGKFCGQDQLSQRHEEITLIVCHFILFLNKGMSLNLLQQRNVAVVDGFIVFGYKAGLSPSKIALNL